MKGHQFKSWIFEFREILRDQEFSLFLRFVDPIISVCGQIGIIPRTLAVTLLICFQKQILRISS
jgi:hypothetical protein